jgi:hypothetical protein
MARAVQTAIDSLNFFVESRNAGNIITATATISAAGISPDQTNLAQHGAMFFVALASVSVSSATIQLSINAKDVVSGTYFPYLKASVDGLSAAGSQGMLVVYPGIVGGGFLNANNATASVPLPNVFQVVTSMTISSTTATNSGTATLTVDYSKIM